MICDLNEFPDNAALQADVVIVGAGPAGIALANELRSTRLEVVLVEAGGLELEPASQELNTTDCVGLPHNQGKDGRARVFGGAGKLWAGQCLRLDEIDFTARSWVPFSGWPLQLKDLEEFYQRAESFFRVEGEFYDERVYAGFRLKPPRWLESKLSSMFTVYTPDLDTGVAWQSRISSAPNIRLLLHANVVDIALEPSGRAFSHLVVQTIEGRRAKVLARTAVLCAGGLENARLLLLARSQQPEGLGNANGLVGRFFQEHPNGFTADIVASAKTAPGLQSTFRMLYGKNGRRYFPKFRLAAEVQQTARVLNCNASLLFEYADDSGTAALQNLFRTLKGRRKPDKLFHNLGGLIRGAPEVVNSTLRRALFGLSPAGRPTRVRLQCYLEQAPNPESRISLSENTDRLGLPLISVDWRMTDLELRTLRMLTETVQSEFSRLKMGELRIADWVCQDSGWEMHLADCAHHCGTTRMSDNPLHGVVDANCKIFGLDGLYTGGSSVFPTSGYANPTLTIVALSIRLADHLKSALI